MIRYVDADFTSQGSRKVWSAGTPHATSAQLSWYSDLDAAIADAVAGDVLKVASGTYQLPPSIDTSTFIAGLSGTILSAPSSVDVNDPLDGYCVVQDGVVVRLKGVSVTSPVCAIGSIVLDGISAAVSGKILDTGAIIAIGSINHSIDRDQEGSYERYDSYFDEGRWPSQFPVAQYRNSAVLEAPAKYRTESGSQKVRWVAIADFRYLIKDGIGSEINAGSVNMGLQGSTFFTKPGLPVHQDMRISTKGRTYQITAISRPSGPGQDLRLTVTEKTGM